MKRFQDLQLKTMIKNAKEAKEGKKGSRPDQGHNPQQSYENFQEKKAKRLAKKMLKERRIQAALTQGYLVLDKKRLLNGDYKKQANNGQTTSKVVESLYISHLKKIGQEIPIILETPLVDNVHEEP